MTPEERIQKLNDVLNKAKEAFNRGLGKLDNVGQTFDSYVNPQDNPPAPPANDVAKKPPAAPKKTKKIYRF